MTDTFIQPKCETVPSGELAYAGRLSCGDSTEMPLFGDYARMLLVVNAVFLGSLLAATSRIDTVRFVGIAIAAWVTLRVSFLRWRWFLPCITACLVIAAVPLLSADHHADFDFHQSAVAIRLLFAMLLLVGFADLNATAKWTSGMAQQKERAAAFRNLLLRHGSRFLFWSAFTVLLGHTIVAPLIWEVVPDQHSNLDRLTLPMSMLFRFSEFMTAVFVFAIGLCVGSFLNVVIYRLPQKISVLIKPSYCPGCESEIESRDNLPLLGWLNLKGQCRHCEVQIPVRYPTVELMTGLAFLTLYFVELISGGTNLPGRSPNGYAGVLWIVFYTKWDLVGLYLYHCVLLCTVFSWAMIGLDGHHVPRLNVTLTLITVAVLQFCFPGLQLLHGLDLNAGAVLYDRQGRFGLAEREYERAIAEGRPTADLLNDFGYFRYVQERLTVSENLLTQALQVDPSHAQAQVNLAMVHAAREDYETAYQLFQESVGPAAAHQNIGILLLRDGQHQRGLVHLNQASAIDPSLQTAHTLLAASGVDSIDGPIQTVNFEE